MTSTLVIVRARNLNTDTIKNPVPVPKNDFSLNEADFAKNSERVVLSRNMDLNHRQFHRTENERENRRESGTSVHGPGRNITELHDFITGSFSNRDHQNGSHENRYKERTNHTTESGDSEFGLATFKSETKIRDRNAEKHLDTPASSHNQKSNNSNESGNHSQKNRHSVKLSTTSNNSNNASIQHDDKEDNLRPKDNFEMDLKPTFTTSAKPTVIESKSLLPKNDDQWIWPEDNNNKPPVTSSTSTEPPTTTDLDDRTAFNGDKCPTGTIRVGNFCAPVD